MNNFGSNQIVFHSTFLANPIEIPLSRALRLLEIEIKVKFHPIYNHITQLSGYRSMTVDEAHALHVILLSADDIVGSLADFHRQTDSSRFALVKQNTRHVVQALGAFRAGYVSRFAVAIWSLPPNIAGSLKEELNSTYLNDPSVDIWELGGSAGLDGGREMALRETREMIATYDGDAYLALALCLARRLAAQVIPRPKVIAVDCDGTLWHGECGENTSLTISTPYSSLQKMLLERQNTGTLLAIVSKNRFSEVISAFDETPGMLLRREQILAWKVNHTSKSENIKAVASELHTDFGSILFIDNDPFECAEVEFHCPGVNVLCVPEDPCERDAVLAHCWLLDPVKPTSEDMLRPSWIKTDRLRTAEAAARSSREDFLRHCGLLTYIQSAAMSDIHRVSQLTRRTNQFNSTGERWSQESVKLLFESDTGRLWTGSATDRFGDYGIIAAAICSVEQGVLHVKSFVLSCRALFRYIEDSMLVSIAEWAFVNDLLQIKIKYADTGRNACFYQFRDRMRCSVPMTDGPESLIFDTERLLRASRRDTFGSHYHLYEDDPEPLNLDSLEGSPQPFEAIRVPAEQLGRLGRARSSKDFNAILKDPQIAAQIDRDCPAREYIAGQIRAIWQRAIGNAHFTEDDDFFVLGGDSLQALEIIYELNETFGVDVSLSLLFAEAFTVSGLVTSVEALLIEQKSQPTEKA